MPCKWARLRGLWYGVSKQVSLFVVGKGAGSSLTKHPPPDLQSC